MEAADGVIDSMEEKFVLPLGRRSPGEHVLVLRAIDSANNAGSRKLFCTSVASIRYSNGGRDRRGATQRAPRYGG